MDLEIIALIVLLAMFVLMFLKIPIAISMAVPAFVGILYLRDWTVLKSVIETVVWKHSYSYTLSTIPLFVLMGEILFVTGISSSLFETFRTWVGRLKGGLAVATIGSSALFAAASGSSLANTGTMGVIASKEMTKAGYSKSLAGGSIIAGGSLGMLIPPSTMFIIYGMMTETSIGKLLIAGIIPGIVLSLLYVITVYVSILINPSLAPRGKGSSWKEKFYSLRHTGWILLLFLIVIGGMYIGLFSPTEAAGVGAFFALIIALLIRKLTWQNFIESLSRTLKTTGFIFAIMLAAFLFNYLLTITRLPQALAGFFTDLNMSPFALFLLIVFMYLILGAIMDTMAMIVITVPIIMPLIQAMGFDLVWFGVFIILVVEMAMMSPPVGMLCFVLDGVAPDLKIENIFKGAIRFMIPILVLVMLLYFVPEIATFLPDNMR
ncbi:C4-dicarboxylate transporter DctM subunit [Neobacillus niacini]|uniref:TRAP transporter large permease n=1 Tax=Neobacillus niacini TaxID=86668 RepID=UPI00277E8DDB|nr:TRAP transporter large permease [Neobacillus niacini]MDQ1002211.1 C4-dicarboxylate transporter DctM subunit [Neobacillus niacini]